MVRAKLLKHGQKAKVTITPSRELLEWVVAHTGEGREFASITHAVERGWAILRERELAANAAEARSESKAARRPKSPGLS